MCVCVCVREREVEECAVLLQTGCALHHRRCLSLPPPPPPPPPPPSPSPRPVVRPVAAASPSWLSVQSDQSGMRDGWRRVRASWVGLGRAERGEMRRRRDYCPNEMTPMRQNVPLFSVRKMPHEPSVSLCFRWPRPQESKVDVTTDAAPAAAAAASAAPADTAPPSSAGCCSHRRHCRLSSRRGRPFT